MENLRAFKVTTLPATNHKPTRMRITDLRYDESTIVHYSAEGSSEETARATEFLAEKGIIIKHKAWREIKGKFHDCTLLLTENFDKRIL